MHRIVNQMQNKYSATLHFILITFRYLWGFSLIFLLLKKNENILQKTFIIGNTIWFIIHPLEKIEKNSLFSCNVLIFTLPSSTVKFWSQNFSFDLKSLILVAYLLTLHDSFCCASWCNHLYTKDSTPGCQNNPWILNIRHTCILLYKK